MRALFLPAHAQHFLLRVVGFLLLLLLDRVLGLGLHLDLVLVTLVRPWDTDENKLVDLSFGCPSKKKPLYTFSEAEATFPAWPCSAPVA